MKTDREVLKLFQAFERCGEKGRAGMKANMSRNTAAKYLKSRKLPSETVHKRTWRTHADAFSEVWPEVEQMLRDLPELEAKAVFEYLVEDRCMRFQEGQLRTFQRRVREWRALHGPDKEVFFAQEHRPGEAMQWDFWEADELGVTIAGVAFPHMLFHAVLPYSNWEHVTVSRSESMLAIRAGLTRSMRRLQHIAQFVQSDSSSAATHRIVGGVGSGEAGGLSERGFNKEYEDLIRHYGMTPRRIGVGKSEQNGDVEALHNALRRRLEQRLKLRGSRDFESLDAYQAWLDEVCERANAHRDQRVGAELKTMRPLSASLVTEYRELSVPVLSGSTINVKRNLYSVPSRLIGEEVDVRLYDSRVEVYFMGELQLRVERLTGQGHARIDYRHVVHSLVRKPGAFERYRFREEMFPTLTFRKAYDALCGRMTNYRAAKEYLLILKLAADTMESQVETALELLLDSGKSFVADDVRALAGPERPELPAMAPLVVQLADYDALLGMALQEEAA
ncbi:MAG: IS21 family transposase [Deltaproteobacteria bacterium]|nr:IS21 family transposase [Deltaproteobacteria bacterium]